MWEEQVEKAFIFCWAEWNFMMVLMMYIYERNIPILVNTARVTTLCSMNHVSEQEIFIIGEASQRKWSMTLESQNSMFKPRQSGGNITRQPVIQQQQQAIYHLSHIIWYLSFSVWLTSLIVMIPRSIHAAANGIISFFFNGWIIFHCVYMYHTFFHPVICWWAFSLLPCKDCCK